MVCGLLNNMATETYKVGQAPWEIQNTSQSFPVGQAPWETSSTPIEQPKTFGQKITSAATGISNFFGFKGVADEYGATIARARAPQDQKDFVQFPSTKEVVGSAIQSAANFIPGVGTGASLATKVGVGAATGYAMDLGSSLQNKDKTTGQAFIPNIGTAVGVALPLASQLIGNLTKKGSEQLAQNLEKTNLRLTPKDKSFIEESKPDFIKWLTEKKVTGNPEQRYTKISSLYDDFENTIQKTIKETNGTIPKSDFIQALVNIPEQFIDDPQLYDASSSAVDKIIKIAQEKYPDNIPLDFVNQVKRNYGKRAFDKAAQQVVNESSYQISQNLYDILKAEVPQLEGLNQEYSKVILAKKLMYKALGRSQIGIVGKIASSVIGGGVGGAIGGPVGAGAGIIIGENAARNMLGTKTRSISGATAQRLFEKVSSAPATTKSFNISRKLLIQLIEQLKS